MPDLAPILALSLTSAGVSLIIIAAWVAFDRRRGRREPSHADSANLHAEAGELTALLIDRLEEKAARIERLIRHADRRIAALRGAMNSPPDPPPLPASPVSRRADAAPAPAPPPATSSIHADSLEPLSAEVYQLADAGLSPLEIARKLALDATDVELILALRESDSPRPAPAPTVSMMVAKSARFRTNRPTHV